MDQNGTVIATYTYDALGRRIGIKDGGTQTWTVFNGTGADANPYADFNASAALNMRYLYGPAVDQILARTDSSGNTAWYITDKLGSVVQVVSSATGAVVLDNITYDPFGNIVSQTNSSNGDRFLFAGMQYDATTGIYYDHARYYDAAIGRFMSQDPMGFAAGDTNLYRYVQNTPTDASDPSGLLPTYVSPFNPWPPRLPGRGYGGYLLPEGPLFPPPIPPGQTPMPGPVQLEAYPPWYS